MKGKRKLLAITIPVFFLLIMFSSLLLNASRGDERRITYHINHSSLSTTYIDNYLEGETTYIAFPANINFSPANGYHFLNWNTQPDGNGVMYSVNDGVSLDGDIDLYAVWGNSLDPITAIVYDDSSYNLDNSTTLTSGGSVGSDWNYEQIRYLKINLSGDQFANGQESTLSITLYPGIYIYDNNYTAADDNIITDVNFIKYASGTGSGLQDTGPYSNEATGTLTYVFSPDATTGEVIIPIMFDMNLWSQIGHDGNLAGHNPLVRVMLDDNYAEYYSFVEASTGYHTSKDNPFNMDASVWPFVELDGPNSATPFASIYRYGSSSTYHDTYYKEIVVTITNPYKDNNNLIRADYDSSYVGDLLSVYPDNCVLDSSDSAKIIITCHDIQYEAEEIYRARYFFSSSDGWVDGDIARTQVEFMATNYFGQTVINRSNLLSFIVQLKRENIVINSAQKIHNFDYVLPSGYSEYLGGLSLYNGGVGDSSKKRITMDVDLETTTPNTRNKVDVELIMVPAVSKATAGSDDQDINFVIVDMNNNPVSGTATLERSADNDNGGIPLRIQSLIDVYNGGVSANIKNVSFLDSIDTSKEYFLKQVQYEIDTIPAGAYLYAESSTSATDSGGTMWGRLVAVGAKYMLTVESWDNTTRSYIDPITKTITSSARDNAENGSTSTYLSALYFDADNTSKTIVAGDLFNIAGQAIPTGYQYASSSFSPKPVIYLVLPVGINIVNNLCNFSVKTDSDTKSIDSFNIEKRDYLTPDGKQIWTITFPNDDAGYGAYKITDDGPTYNSRLNYNITFSTDSDMDLTSHNLAAFVFLGDELYDEQISDSYASTKLNDVYDLDQDGSTADIFGALQQDQSRVLTIIPSTNPLTATVGVRKKFKNEYISGENNSVYIDDIQDVVEYKLTLSNQSGGIVRKDNFYYYIPIAGNLASLPESMRGSQLLDSTYQLQLNEAAAITGDTGYYIIKYSTNATNTNYDNGSYAFNGGDGAYATYYTAEEINNMNAWNDVKMIKIAANQNINYIPADSITNIIFDMSYKGTNENLTLSSGNSNIFKTIGIQKQYDSNNSLTSNVVATVPVNIAIKYKNTYNITLTGANGEPRNGSKSYTINFPALTSNQDFEVLDYSLNGIELGNYDHINNYAYYSLPSAYQQVEYIESTGTQYIDTGYYFATENSKIIADLMVTSNSSNQTLFGDEEYTNAAHTSASRNFSDILYGAKGKFTAWVGNGPKESIDIGLNTRRLVEYETTDSKNYIIKMGDVMKSGSYSGSIMTHENGDGTAFNKGNIFIFANHRTGDTSAFQKIGGMRLYSFTMYDNDTLVRKFIPCYRKSDNEIGLYDMVNDVFYVDPKANSFLKGADVMPVTNMAINNTFGIMINHNGDNYDLSDGPGKIGTINGNEANNLTITLANYDGIANVTEPKSLAVVLGNKDGIEITVNININRERNDSENYTSGIDNGKIYNLFDATKNSITTKQNGSFTSQYIVEGIVSSSYTSNSLVFNKTIPRGTRILMIDETGDNPIYYKYTLPSNMININLSDFVNLDNNQNFNNTVYDNERFIFVIDFSDTDTLLATGDYDMKLRLNGVADYDILSSFRVESSRTFSLTDASIDGNIVSGLTISGKINTANDILADSYYYGKKIALRISILDNDDNEISMPLGTVIKVGSSGYYPHGKYIIIPLDGVKNTEYNYVLKIGPASLIAGDYKIKTETYVSETNNASSPFAGDMVLVDVENFSIAEQADYALRMSTVNNNHIYSKEELAHLKIHLDYNEDSANNPIRVEIFKKENGIYLRKDNLLTSATISKKNYPASSGAISYPANTYQPDGLDIILNMASGLFDERGTYRIKAYIPNVVGNCAEAYFNIVVKK